MGELFSFCNCIALAFAKEQIARGAELFGFGRCRGIGLRAASVSREFAWRFEEELIDGLPELCAKVQLYMGANIRPIFPPLVGRVAILLIWIFMEPEHEARRAMGERQELLGNLEPAGVPRNGTPLRVRTTLAECHCQADGSTINGAGGEEPPDIPHQNLRAWVDYSVKTAA